MGYCATWIPASVAGEHDGLFSVLANQPSPIEVFETYESAHSEGEPIRLVESERWLSAGVQESNPRNVRNARRAT